MSAPLAAIKCIVCPCTLAMNIKSVAPTPLGQSKLIWIVVLPHRYQEYAHQPLTSVKTAIAIQESTRNICADNAMIHDCLRINIGINSGTALVGFTKYESNSGDRVTFTASGRTTIVAARLEATATGGSVLLSEETMRRVADRQEFAALGWRADSLGAVQFKNLSDPEQVYRLNPTAK